MVYNVRGKDIPIVHRVVRSYAPQAKAEGGKIDVDVSGVKSSYAKVQRMMAGVMEKGSGRKQREMLLTKGDNNVADDTELYARGQSYLDRKEDVIGSVRGYVPMVGYVTIMLSEHPWLKSVLLGLMGLTVVLQRE